MFEQRGDIVSRGVHLRSILHDPRWQKVTDGTSGARRLRIRFDYCPEDGERVRLIGNLPYESWVAAGREAMAAGEHRETARYFAQALGIAPCLHEAHAQLAIAYLHRGKRQRAEQALGLALENAPRRSTRSLYEAKLAVLDRKAGTS
ncbi:MAG: tetratricopeptide repeat protein [Pseudomonadota bacterium]